MPCPAALYPAELCPAVLAQERQLPLALMWRVVVLCQLPPVRTWMAVACLQRPLTLIQTIRPDGGGGGMEWPSLRR